MAKKTVETPGGKKLNIEAPDGATDDEIVEFAKSHLQKQANDEEKNRLQESIDGQNRAIDILRDDVLNMAKLMLTLTDRLNTIEKREFPVPQVNFNPTMPDVKLPEINVASDPAVAEAMRKIGEMHQETLKKIIESLATFGEAMVQSKQSKTGTLEFKVIPVSDRHSPRFGRIDKVQAVVGD